MWCACNIVPISIEVLFAKAVSDVVTNAFASRSANVTH